MKRVLPLSDLRLLTSDLLLPDVFAQLHVPIRQIHEVLPAVVLMQAEIDLHEWPPFRAFRFAHQVHARFLRRAIRLERIALDARADNVLPRRRAAAIARNDVIEVQVLPVENMAAVLARVFVALENIRRVNFTSFFGMRSNTTSRITRGMRMRKEMVLIDSGC